METRLSILFFINMKINPKLKEDLKDFLKEKIKQEQGRVLVLSADNLGSDDKKGLENKFKELDWKNSIYQIDKSIIAGIVVKIGSKTVDLSLAGSLSKLSNTLYEID